MKVTLSELFARLESLTANMRVEIDVGENPAPGSIQEAAKTGGVSGVFRFIKKLAEQPPQLGTLGSDPIASILDGLKNIASEQLPKSDDPKLQQLQNAGVQGLSAFTGALAKIIKDSGSEASSDSGSGKSPETPKDTDTSVVPDNTEHADEERPALPALPSRTYSTKLV